MTSKLIGMVTVFVLALSGRADDVPLEVRGGDVRIVQVDKIIIVKTDLTVVQSFPFTVQAPFGAALYFWSVPVGVQSVDSGDKLQIETAPAGPLTIALKMVVIDWDKKQTITRYGKLSFSINTGTTPIKPPPVDPVDPVDPPPTGETLGFTTLAQTEAAKIPVEARKHAAALANNFGEVAGELHGGRLTIATSQDALQLANRKTLPVGVREVWVPWFRTWGAKADEAKLRTPQDYVTAYRETMAGLKAVK